MVSKTIREIIIRPLKDRISKIRKEMKKAKGRETKKMLNEELDYCKEMMDGYKVKKTPAKKKLSEQKRKLKKKTVEKKAKKK